MLLEKGMKPSMNNCININMKKNQVIIKIDENAEQREIVSW